jgi:hypothetical protein
MQRGRLGLGEKTTNSYGLGTTADLRGGGGGVGRLVWDDPTDRRTGGQEDLDTEGAAAAVHMCERDRHGIIIPKIKTHE